MHFQYQDAMNGYWAPLFSWLLIPFLAAGITPLLAVKLLSIVIGFITIIQLDCLITIVNVRPLLRSVLLYILAILILFFAFAIISPDLLFVCIALVYINTILYSSYSSHMSAGILSGFLGSLLYLAKTYGFPFFVSHFLLIHLLFFLRTKERAARTKIVTNYVLGMIVFILISFCWIFLLSQKYQHITVGLAGNYNHILVGPNSPGHPMLYMGLLDPPNATAISAWEDISYVKMQDKPWLDSPETLVFEIGNIYKNILKVISIYKEYSMMSLILLPAAVLFSFGTRPTNGI